MTVFEFQARRVERISAALAHFISTTPEDRLSWEADGMDGAKGRDIYSMASEIVVVNTLVAKSLTGTHTEPIKPPGQIPAIVFSGSTDAQDQIVESGKLLAAAFRNMTDVDLDRTYPHWTGPLRGEIWLEFSYRNMAYHAGQINFIQILLGDNVFHVPPGTWR